MNQESFRHARTVAELEAGEKNRVDQIQIPISETSSQIARPEEPVLLRDETNQRQPKLPEMLNYARMFAGIEKSRATALLEMRRRKDWVNSALYHNYVLMEQESGPLDTI